MMTKAYWNYPVLLGSLAIGQKPGFADLRFLVRRVRQEISSRTVQSRELRRRVRAIVTELTN